MPRQRMIQPEFWKDQKVGKWSYAARLLYIGLWNFSDDEGRFEAHPDAIIGQIFMYNKDINIDDLKKELGDKIQWYEVNGEQYGYLRNFLKHQKIKYPTPSKLPEPPEFPQAFSRVPPVLPQSSQKSAANIVQSKIDECNINQSNAPENPGAEMGIKVSVTQEETERLRKLARDQKNANTPPPPEDRTSPEVKDLLKYFELAYRKVRKLSYPTTKNKRKEETKIFKDLIKDGQSPDEIKALIDKFFSSDDAFITEGAYTITLFRGVMYKFTHGKGKKERPLSESERLTKQRMADLEKRVKEKSTK